MEVANKTDLATIRQRMITENVISPVNGIERLIVRRIIFEQLQEKIIPEQLDKLIFPFIARCYDNTNTGYNGILKEIKIRIDTYRIIGQSVFVRDFFKATDEFSDMIDEEEGICTEIKTGCGEWLRSKTDNLDEIRKEYETSGNRILWDYNYRAKDENDVSFHIKYEGTWTEFFCWLDGYEKGYKTFFKLNKANSVKAQCFIYDMNTIRTSKKKIAYLTGKKYERGNEK